MKLELEIRNPIAKFNIRKRITLTRRDAMIISAMLDNHRKDLASEPYESEQVKAMEDMLDAQLWGKVRLNGEWVKP